MQQRSTAAADNINTAHITVTAKAIPPCVSF